MRTTKYSTFLTKLDFELKQVKESGDSADAEKYRVLPRSQTPSYVNDMMKELVRINEKAYTEEIVITLFDSSDGEYYPPRDGEVLYVDIVDHVNGTLLTMPDRVYKIYAIMTPINSDTRLGNWIQPFDSTVSNSTIYCPSENTIYNYDEWESGDVIRVKACLYPDDIYPEFDTVSINSATEATNCVLSIPSNPGIYRGMDIVISGSTGGNYDGTHKVLMADSTSVTLDLDSTALGGIGLAAELDFEYGDQILPIDDGYIRLLLLKVKRIAYSRINKPLNQYEFSELIQTLTSQWATEKGTVTTKSKLRFKGFNFGGGR